MAIPLTDRLWLVVDGFLAEIDDVFYVLQYVMVTNGAFFKFYIIR